jgi:hypothetical protein
MASVRGTDVQSRPTECLDGPSVPLEEFSVSRLTLHDRVPSAYGGVVPRWATPDRPPVYGGQDLPLSYTGRSAVLHAGLPENLCPPRGARAPV